MKEITNRQLLALTDIAAELHRIGSRRLADRLLALAEEITGRRKKETVQ